MQFVFFNIYSIFKEKSASKNTLVEEKIIMKIVFLRNEKLNLDRKTKHQKKKAAFFLTRSERSKGDKLLTSRPAL
jgi:hypothetical protein